MQVVVVVRVRPAGGTRGFILADSAGFVNADSAGFILPVEDGLVRLARPDGVVVGADLDELVLGRRQEVVVDYPVIPYNTHTIEIHTHTPRTHTPHRYTHTNTHAHTHLTHTHAVRKW